MISVGQPPEDFKYQYTMNCRLETKEIQCLESSKIVQQTSFWAEVKHRQGLEPLAFKYSVTDDLLHPQSKRSKLTMDDLLVLIKYIDQQHCVAYIPYGPKDEPEFENHGVFIEEMSEVLRSYLPEKCIMIRYDLPWENQWARQDDCFDNEGNWIGPPAFESQELRLNFNTKKWNIVKSQTDVLPTNTIFLNLEKNETNLLGNMKPKTRYNIRLALRKGVQVKNYGMERLNDWYKLYRETALRNGIIVHGIDFFSTVLKNQQYHSENEVKVHLLLADYEGEILAGMFLALSKDRGTYLYGASTIRQRQLMATYALQWEAIRLAQEEGCTQYDMFGTAPNAYPSHPMHGLYRFKSGFGGNMFHRMGCWDYPLMTKEYQAFRAHEVRIKFHHG